MKDNLPAPTPREKRIQRKGHLTLAPVRVRLPKKAGNEHADDRSDDRKA